MSVTMSEMLTDQRAAAWLAMLPVATCGGEGGGRGGFIRTIERERVEAAKASDQTGWLAIHEIIQLLTCLKHSSMNVVF